MALYQHTLKLPNISDSYFLLESRKDNTDKHASRFCVRVFDIGSSSLMGGACSSFRFPMHTRCSIQHECMPTHPDPLFQTCTPT